MEPISKEEIIEINRQLGGDLVANGSIDYALHAGKAKSIYRLIALIWRAIIVDHPFTDRNKRTALNVTSLILRRQDITLDDEAMERIAKEMLKSQRITSLQSKKSKGG